MSALVRRDFATTRSYRLAFVLDLGVGALSLLIYYFISRTFIDTGTADLNGASSYFAFAAVGVAMAIVVTSAASGLAGTLRQEQFTGTLEALAVQPITTSEMAMGLAGYPFFFSMFRAAFYLLLASVLLGADYSRADWPGVVLLMLLTAASLTSLGIALGALVFVVQRGQAVTSLVMFPLIVLGGAYFPIEVLPGWLEALGRVVPTRFSFDGVRAALFRGEGWTEQALVLACFGLVALPLAVGLFGRALALAERRGTLTQY